MSNVRWMDNEGVLSICVRGAGQEVGRLGFHSIEISGKPIKVLSET